MTVYGEPDLTGVYDVNPNGDLDLPLIGQVKAVGRDATDARGRSLPTATSAANSSTIRRSRSRSSQYRPVYIFGEVSHPGPIPYASGLNVLTAITTAGGLTYRGDKSTVLIQHAGEQAWTQYPLLSSVTVLPGDIIRVPEIYF